MGVRRGWRIRSMWVDGEWWGEVRIGLKGMYDFGLCVLCMIVFLTCTLSHILT